MQQGDKKKPIATSKLQPPIVSFFNDIKEMNINRCSPTDIVAILYYTNIIITSTKSTCIAQFLRLWRLDLQCCSGNFMEDELVL